MAAFEQDYAGAVAGVLARGGLKREPKWTQAIAVGDEEYVRNIAAKVRGRATLLCEDASPYAACDLTLVSTDR